MSCWKGCWLHAHTDCIRPVGKLAVKAMEVNREGYLVDATEPGAFIAISMACYLKLVHEFGFVNLMLLPM
ncbi:hypothetical protein Tco_0879935 [Tanacetum coccineum]